jgi:diaminobutyrate-2-oxoglutarate transaminase
MFSFEHAGIEPDIVVLSKAIGGGLPLAVVVYHERLDVWRPGAHAGTFRGNQLAMAAGSAVLDMLARDRLDAAASDAGARLMQRLQQRTTGMACVGEVRGRGLMVGMELVDRQQPDAQGRPGPATETANRLQRECLRRGLILELGGRHGSVVRLLPPLTITTAQVDEVADVLASALEAMS